MLHCDVIKNNMNTFAKRKAYNNTNYTSIAFFIYFYGNVHKYSVLEIYIFIHFRILKYYNVFIDNE